MIKSISVSLSSEVRDVVKRNPHEKEQLDEAIKLIGPSCRKFLGLNVPEGWNQYWSNAYGLSTRLVVNIQFTVAHFLSVDCVFYRENKKRVLGMNFVFSPEGIKVVGVVPDPILHLK